MLDDNYIIKDFHIVRVFLCNIFEAENLVLRGFVVGIAHPFNLCASFQPLRILSTFAHPFNLCACFPNSFTRKKSKIPL